MGLEGRRERGRVRVCEGGRVRERGPQSRPCLAESRVKGALQLLSNRHM